MNQTPNWGSWTQVAHTCILQLICYYSVLLAALFIWESRLERVALLALNLDLNVWCDVLLVSARADRHLGEGEEKQNRAYCCSGHP